MTDKPPIDSDYHRSRSTPHHTGPFKKKFKRLITGKRARVIALIVAGLAIIFQTLLAHAGDSISDKLSDRFASSGQAISVDTADDKADATFFTYAYKDRLALSQQDLRHLDMLGKHPADLHDWFRQRQGVHVDDIVIDMTISTKRSSEIKIINLRPETECTAPLSGTLFWSPSQGGGLITSLIYDLDNPSSSVAYFTGASGDTDSSQGDDYFAGHIISIAPGERFSIKVRAFTRRQSCQLRFVATVMDGGHTLRLPIDDHGRPFAVTALAGGDGGTEPFKRYGALYVNGAGVPYRLWQNDQDGVPQLPDAWRRIDPPASYDE